MCYIKVRPESIQKWMQRTKAQRQWITGASRRWHKSITIELDTATFGYEKISFVEIKPCEGSLKYSLDELHRIKIKVQSIIVSPKHCSLAFDEAVKDFDETLESNSFEPELKVIVNAHYLKSSFSHMVSEDIIQVNGRITVSF